MRGGFGGVPSPTQQAQLLREQELFRNAAAAALQEEVQTREAGAREQLELMERLKAAVCYSPPHIPENSGNSDQNIQTPGGIAQGLKNESKMSGNSENSRWISGVVIVVVAAAFTNKKTTFVWGSTRIFV